MQQKLNRVEYVRRTWKEFNNQVEAVEGALLLITTRAGTLKDLDHVKTCKNILTTAKIASTAISFFLEKIHPQKQDCERIEETLRGLASISISPSLDVELKQLVEPLTQFFEVLSEDDSHYEPSVETDGTPTIIYGDVYDSDWSGEKQTPSGHIYSGITVSDRATVHMGNRYGGKGFWDH